MVRENGMRVTQWQIGRVEDVYPGDGGRVRVASKWLLNDLSRSLPIQTELEICKHLLVSLLAGRMLNLVIV